MNTPNNEQFVKDYIEAWSTKDDATRATLVRKVYAEDAYFYASEPNDVAIKIHGLAEITANIAHVNTRDIQGNGLTIETKKFDVNYDAVKVSWQMMTGDGNVAMTGMNILLRDTSGKILHDYIFIG